MITNSEHAALLGVTCLENGFDGAIHTGNEHILQLVRQCDYASRFLFDSVNIPPR